MDKIMKIAQKYKLAVVEDAAQGLGSMFKGKRAGSFGEAAAFSFYPAKILGSMGDAGAITTSDSKLFERMYQLHDHGRDKAGEVRSWGRNSRLDNLQAALLNLRFINYQDTIDRRRHIASIYDENLKDIPELSLPEPPSLNSDHYDTFQNYEILASNRDELRNFLKSEGIGTLIQWNGRGIHQWKHLNFQCSLPKTDYFFKHSIMLPVNLFISDDNVLYVCEKVKEFYEKQK